ncbi:sensor histidine kinase [Corynebacterium minutissimum]|uniref:histidine kinase n=1 Tax=Corynebacterium minutissimum TaxID=38301 RepID=A0A376CWB4_9CORY|nr:histidine kinase [Corynebacterium minutissimum]QRP60552.1 two-component sensor histidine kinase [Corynebacterium minutissimum]STC76270.1 two-component system sensor histidine kinase [Corynebacterium minutissimum]
MSFSRTARAFLTSVRLGDALLSGVAGLVAAFYCALAASSAGTVEVIEALLSLLFIPFFLVWRSKPVLSAAGFLVLLSAWAVTWMSQLPANSGLPPWALTAPMAVYTTSRYINHRLLPRAILLITALGTFISPFMWRIDVESYLLRYEVDTHFLAMVVAHWAVLGSTYFIAARYFDRDRQREALARERFHQAQEEERLLIARELHDVLAHSLTLIKVQANAGIVAATSDSGAAEDALLSIRENADSALGEVRGIVAALRSPGPTSLEPAQQLEHIEAILEGFRVAGLKIDANLPASFAVPSLVQMALVRIITEGLTNALRHQGVGTHVTVELALDDAPSLTLTSTNQHPSPSNVSGSGVGLVGIGERARSLGGRLDYSGDAHVFNLHAQIPMKDTKNAAQQL